MEQTQEKPQSQTSKKKSQWKAYTHIFVLVPVVIAMITLLIYAWQWKSTLRVQRVIVDGANHLQAKEIVEISAIPPQAVLAGLDCRAIEQKLMAYPLIKQAEVITQLPDAMRIKIVEREPFAAINGSQVLYVDSDGVLLPRLKSLQFDLPLISGLQNIDSTQLGKVLAEKNIKSVIDVLKKAQEVGWYHLISEIKVNEQEEIVLFAIESGVPIILGKDKIEERLIRLQTFWSNFAKNGNAAYLRYVDLRFDGEVVVKWDKRMSGQATKYQL